MINMRGSMSQLGRIGVLATVAAVGLTTITPSLVQAAPASSPVSTAAAAKDSGLTDVSARPRHHYRGGGAGGAAAAAAFAGIVGTGLAIAAQQNRRSYYDDYYGRPAYYGPGPSYYGGYGGGPYDRGW